MPSAVDILEERVVAAAELIASLRDQGPVPRAGTRSDSGADSAAAPPHRARRRDPSLARGARAAARRAGRGPREHPRAPPGDRPGVLVSAEHVTVRIYGENYPLRTGGAGRPARGARPVRRRPDAGGRGLGQGRGHQQDRRARRPAHRRRAVPPARDAPRDAPEPADLRASGSSALAETLERALAPPPDGG